jgi:hypothetical protein
MNPEYKVGHTVVYQPTITLGPIASPFKGIITDVGFWGGCWRYTILAGNNNSLVGCEQHWLKKDTND